MIIKPKKEHVLDLLPDRLVLVHGARRGNARYLTFDDGPHPEHTPRVLDVLAAHGAKASFFLVGRNVERHPGVVERIVAEGHMLGNHSWSHPSFTRIPLRQQLEEIARTDRLLADFDGLAEHRVRTPYALLPLRLLLHFARTRRNLVYWSYNSMDYLKQPDAQLVARLRDQPPRAGDIVLMHDDNARVVDVLQAVLPQWQAVGHEFRALSAVAG
jgi:peptidoglycan/xylan/chitin deacetylase (PgdA/CDA1 family)